MNYNSQDILNSYFKTLIFTKIEEKEGFTVYGAGISSGLGAGKQRYILLFVPQHLATKNRAKINELQWKNLQTRELQYSYNMRKQAWKMDRDAKDIILEVKDRNKKYSTYIASGGEYFPFEILLLHNPKKKTIFQYRNRLTLSAAIEMFNSVFNYIGENINTPSVNNWFETSLPYSPSNASFDDTFELLV